MQRAEFQALVQTLESYAQAEPQTYRLRVGLLAALGYGYLLSILAVSLGGLGFLGWWMFTGQRFTGWGAQLGFALGVIVFVILRALWVQFPPPEGTPLTRAQVPQLFELLDQFEARLQTPRFDQVFLTGELNAAVYQRPRFGWFWYENHLILGLPLLSALSPEQFQAVLAHELGHISGNHSRFNGWIYRVRESWNKILEALQHGQDSSAWLFVRFFKWYIPYFNAYSFVLARTNEYEADRCAAETTTPEVMASALTMVEIQSFVLQEKFWPMVNQRVYRDQTPPGNLFEELSQTLHQETSLVLQDQGLRRALSEKTGSVDTHPALTDRLQALGCTATKTTYETTAAQTYLGMALAPLTAELNQIWHRTVTPHWQEQYQEAQELRTQLAELNQKTALTLEERWQQAEWIALLQGNAEAQPYFEALIQEEPNHVSAHYRLGQHLLTTGQASGLTHLEQAMARDPGIILAACSDAMEFHLRQGDDQSYQRYRQRAEQHYDLMELAQAERATVTARDPLVVHGLPVAALLKFQEVLRRHPQIQSAYLVQKVVQHLPEQPFYVLGINHRNPFWTFDSQEAQQTLLNTLLQELEFPGETWVVLLKGNAGLAKAIQKVTQEPIYQK